MFIFLVHYNADQVFPGPALENDELPSLSDEDDGDNDNDDNDNDTVDGPKILAHVDLAITICE